MCVPKYRVPKDQMLTIAVIRGHECEICRQGQRRLSTSFIIGAMRMPKQSRISPTIVVVMCLNSLEAIMDRDGDLVRLRDFHV